MKYPSEFPQDARARVEAETLRAYNALEQDVRGIKSWRRDVPFIRCVMRVFLAFVREACAFGKKSNRPAWSDRELDQRCRDFLLSIVIDAWEDKAKDLGVKKMFSSTHHWGYSLDDDAKRRIEGSPEWKQYQQLLLEAFDAQSALAADCNSPQSEQAGDTASLTEVVCLAFDSRHAPPAEPLATRVVEALGVSAPPAQAKKNVGTPSLTAPRPREGHAVKKPVRRNQRYKVIDKALQGIAESRPHTQKEVFQWLEDRHVVLPLAEPFMAARGWMAGFAHDPAAARAWLSKRWTELNLV